jgi:hypothetical protein
MMRSVLPLVDKSARLEEIHYFSALAYHMEPSRPGTVSRHETYLKCLRASGVRVELGRFKRRPIRCRAKCKEKFNRYEEKETDVAIAVRLFELFAGSLCDTAILVTGDTDLGPAIRTAKKLYPHKQVGFAFPYKRKNAELSVLTPIHFRLKRERYFSSQFTDPFVSGGLSIAKPASW